MTTIKRVNKISIKGARVHNLKNIDVEIPHGQLVVITGISGSGKSSLAFDTIYAEGQRRYVESLSSYARQFLGRLNKPDVDHIKGIAPAIAIEQKVISTNPRSTVGTVTEIYDYLKLLFARIGQTYEPKSGKIVKKDTVTDVVKHLNTHNDKDRFLILSPLSTEIKALNKEIQILKEQGFNRLYINDSVIDIETFLTDEIKKIYVAFLVVDRIQVDKENDENNSRLADSIQTAFEEGNGKMAAMSMQNQDLQSFSNLFEVNGTEFVEPTMHFFSFNTPFGACKTCEGFGALLGIDPSLVIPDRSKSVYDDAVLPWKGESMSEWRDALIYNASKFNFPVHKPVFDLTEAEYEILWEGNEYFNGINSYFEYLKSKTYKIHYRVMLSRYRGKTTCPDCKGTRLRKDASYVKIYGQSISDLVLMPISELKLFFENIKLNANEKEISKRILLEINNRLNYLLEVGLPYLTLNRQANSLSGGESQRINLATSLASNLVGSMYILDEPSIGLHERDTQNLIRVLKSLKEMGNTVIVVEHDEEIMRAADLLIDMGPGAGIFGGEIVYQGKLSKINKEDKSLTGKYLLGEEKIEIPSKARIFNKKIELKGARQYNLKNIDITIPLNALTCVSGVSGSGKSTLIKGILYPTLLRRLEISRLEEGEFNSLQGDIKAIEMVEMIDQNPIGKSSRSNPVSYIKAFDEIRELLSKAAYAENKLFSPGIFSFNVEGGRCDACHGEGVVTVSMQFMADVHLKCEACNGSRYQNLTLGIKLKGKNVADILEMSIDNAVEFFKTLEDKLAEKVVHKLTTLQKVGLGYVNLGQSSNTLSGGEAQRVKLASFLVKGNNAAPTLFIFDEPSTGLHFHDIKLLINSFNELILNGHSVLVIEHHPDILKCADWIIDLGPEGGEKGGALLFQGSVKDLLKTKTSYTAKHLKEKFNL